MGEVKLACFLKVQLAIFLESSTCCFTESLGTASSKVSVTVSEDRSLNLSSAAYSIDLHRLRSDKRVTKVVQIVKALVVMMNLE